MGVVLIRRENRTLAVCRDSRIRFEHDPESNFINRSEYQCALQLRRPHMMKLLLRHTASVLFPRLINTTPMPISGYCRMDAPNIWRSTTPFELVRLRSHMRSR